MAHKIWELYYASSQQGILSNIDGFGIRTFTEGFPEAVIEELKQQQLFSYHSGTLPLASSYTLAQDPDIPHTYPPIFAFRNIPRGDGEHYSMFSRSVFIGGDYGNFLPDTDPNARAGNYFVHVLTTEEKMPTSWLKNLDFSQFTPKNVSNRSDNLELRGLLVGEPKLLLAKEWNLESPEGLFSFDPQVGKILIRLLQAWIVGGQVVIRTYEVQSLNLLRETLALLPESLLREISFHTNYQDFIFDPDIRIIFVNEYYSGELRDKPGFYFCDFLEKKFSDLPISNFLERWAKAYESRNLDELKQLNQFIDRFEGQFTNESWDPVLSIYDYLIKANLAVWPTEILNCLWEIRDSSQYNELLRDIVKQADHLNEKWVSEISAVDLPPHKSERLLIDMWAHLSLSQKAGLLITAIQQNWVSREFVDRLAQGEGTTAWKALLLEMNFGLLLNSDMYNGFFSEWTSKILSESMLDATEWQKTNYLIQKHPEVGIRLLNTPGLNWKKILQESIPYIDEKGHPRILQIWQGLLKERREEKKSNQPLFIPTLLAIDQQLELNTVTKQSINLESLISYWNDHTDQIWEDLCLTFWLSTAGATLKDHLELIVLIREKMKWKMEKGGDPLGVFLFKQIYQSNGWEREELLTLLMQLWKELKNEKEIKRCFAFWIDKEPAIVKWLEIEISEPKPAKWIKRMQRKKRGKILRKLFSGKQTN